jgi:hypothetical protein
MATVDRGGFGSGTISLRWYISKITPDDSVTRGQEGLKKLGLLILIVLDYRLYVCIEL